MKWQDVMAKLHAQTHRLESYDSGDFLLVPMPPEPDKITVAIVLHHRTIHALKRRKLIYPMQVHTIWDVTARQLDLLPEGRTLVMEATVNALPVPGGLAQVNA